jgi:hypothetical protein
MRKFKETTPAFEATIACTCRQTITTTLSGTNHGTFLHIAHEEV